LGFSLESLAREELLTGDLHAAREHLEEGWALTQSGTTVAQAYFAAGYGWLAFQQGDYAQARDRFATAIADLEAQHTAELSTAQAWLGAAYLALGDTGQALEWTARAVASLQAFGTAGDYVAQDIWWLRCQTLAASGDADAAWAALDHARSVLLESVGTLSDDGLRRCTFGKVPTNRDIVVTWLREANLRGLPLAPLVDHLRGAGRGQEQFRRLVDIGVRLNARREAAELPQAIIDEVIELIGAESASLLTVDEHGQRRISAQSGPSTTAYAYLDEAEQKRAPLLRYLPDGAPEVEQRSILAVPLIASGRVVGLLHC